MRTFVSKIIQGGDSSTWTPSPTYNCYQQHSSRSYSSGAGAPGQEDSGAANQILVGSRQRRAASEGSLPPEVAGNLETKPIQRYGEGREEQERADKGGMGGTGSFYGGNQEGVQRHDMDRDEGDDGSRGEE